MAELKVDLTSRALTLDFDMNAWIASGADPALQAGQPAFAQIWCRDTADPWGGTLSDAVAFLIGP